MVPRIVAPETCALRGFEERPISSKMNPAKREILICLLFTFDISHPFHPVTAQIAHFPEALRALTPPGTAYITRQYGDFMFESWRASFNRY
jgi:hypothetical protein